MPEYRSLFGLLVQNVLKEPGLIQWRGVGVAFAIGADVRHPVRRDSRIHDLEHTGWVEVRLASVVEYAVIVGLYSDDEVGLPR